jgi:hypothetical protein
MVGQVAARHSQEPLVEEAGRYMDPVMDIYLLLMRLGEM